MKYTVGSGIIGAILFICVVGWLVEGNNFLLFKFFAPREEAVRRQTFEESKAYNDGMAQELSAMELDYVKAAPDQKAALRSVIIHRTAGYDTSRLSLDLQQFVAQVQRDVLTVRP